MNTRAACGSIKLEVVQEDVRYIAADVLLLKFARRPHGADEVVLTQLIQAGLCRHGDVAPDEGITQWVNGGAAIQAHEILFIGTPRLGRFRYREIREFARQAIEAIADHGVKIKTLATTLHGANYGLDIEESLKAMILGFQQGLTAHPLYSLHKILFIERDQARSEMLHRALGDIELVLPRLSALADATTTATNTIATNTTATPNNLPANNLTGTAALVTSCPATAAGSTSGAFSASVEPTVIAGMRVAEAAVEYGGGNGRVAPAIATSLPTPQIELKQRSVFVAMPFSEEFEDVYQFGIYATVRRCGYACEKVDQAMFTGSIVDRITEGIRAADFLIADLTDERPNVYLEVGFAWALEKPVIILAREGQRLHFDVSHHRCLFYRTIGKLSESLERTITEMFGKAS